MNKNLMNPIQAFMALDKDARSFGFEWPHTEAIFAQIISECAEIKHAIDTKESADRIQEEIGDLLNAVACLCTFIGFDPEVTFKKNNIKFANRMRAMKWLTEQSGLPNLKGQSTKFMLDLWDEAKKLEIFV